MGGISLSQVPMVQRQTVTTFRAEIVGARVGRISAVYTNR